MLSKSHPIILFIDRFGFSVYQDTLTNIPKFNFTPDLVVNQDVINKEQLAKLVETFIQINKIIGSSLAVILSDDVIFVKDLQNPVQKPILPQGFKEDLNGDKECKGEMQCFLEDIPFEEVLAKVIKAGNINRVVAVNKDLVMAIADAFVNKGSTIEAITPSYIFGRNANFAIGLNLNNVRIVLEDLETLKLGNLLAGQEKIIPLQILGNEIKNFSSNTDTKANLADDQKKPKNLRQYILIGTFIILLIILGIVYFTLGVSKTTPKNSKAKTLPANTANVSIVTPAAQLTSTQSAATTVPFDIKIVKTKITQSSQIDEKATNLKNELSKLGLQDIASEVSETSVPEKSSVVFSPNIPTDLRNNIIIEIKKILPDISILESQDSNSTLNIVLGKS